MKYFKFLKTFLAIAFIIPLLASCGDDEEDISDASRITGTYAGSAHVNVLNNDCGDMELDIRIDAQTDGTATVTLPQCSFTIPGTDRSHTIASFQVSGVKVTESKNVYHIKADSYSVTLDGVNYSGSIDGKIAGKDANIDYSIMPGAMRMDINFSFKGTLK